MGTNMQKASSSGNKSRNPVMTGMESKVAATRERSIIAEEDGVVEKVDSEIL